MGRTLASFALPLALLACADGVDQSLGASASSGGPAGSSGAGGVGGGAGAGAGAAAGAAGAAAAAGAASATGGANAAGAPTAAGGTGAAGGGAAGAGGGANAGAAGAAGFSPAPHAPFPLVTDHGGATLPHVELFTITYPGYPYATAIEAWADWIPTSSWLATVGADYGVGAGTHSGHLVMSEPAPASISDDQIKGLLAGLVKSGDLPAPTSDTLFMIFFPESTSVVLGGSPSCVSFGAYHASAGGTVPVFAYAVEPACPGTKFGPDELAGVMVAASHELIEAATDARPESKQGFTLTSGEKGAFDFIGGEVGDLCAHQPTKIDGFWVQRSWSSSEALAGRNPCVPVPAGEVYYNVTVPSDSVRAVAAGDSTTFDVTGWSLAPTADWQIDAQKKLADFTPILELDRATLNNGEVAHLKVTVPPGTPSQARAGFVVRSLRGGDTDDYTMWPMAVHVP